MNEYMDDMFTDASSTPGWEWLEDKNHTLLLPERLLLFVPDIQQSIQLGRTEEGNTALVQQMPWT